MRRFLEKYLPWLLAAFSALIYFSTLAPTFSHTDSGELAGVQATLGIAHPTGYPLFTLLGWLWLQLPLPGREVFLSNLLCLFFVAGGVGFFTRFLQELLPEKDISPSVRITSILAAVLMLAFSYTWWLQSTSVEVYSLHILLLTLNLLLLLRAWQAPAGALRPWLLLALGLALGFSNHLTTFLLLPGIAWLFFRKEGINKAAFRTLGLMLTVFFPLLAAVYFYLPWRAAANPVFNWGDPSSWEAFWYHVRGKQFGVWLFESGAVARENFREFWINFPGEFAWIGLPIAGAGLWASFKRDFNLAVFCLLTFVFTVLFVINYSIVDLEAYFLLAYIVTGVWIAWGLMFLLKQKFMAKFPYPALALASLLPVISLTYNLNRCDQSKLFVYEDYTRAALGSLPENAILVTHQWDGLVSGAWYLQFVESFRTDVDIVEFMLMRDRPWYFDWMRHQQPELASRLEPEIQPFQQELRKFAYGKKYSANALQSSFRRLMEALIAKNPDRPIFLAPEMLAQTLQANGLSRPNVVPGQYFFEVVNFNPLEQYQPLLPDNQQIRFPDSDDAYSRQVRQTLSLMAESRARYEQHFGKEMERNLWMEMARELKAGEK